MPRKLLDDSQPFFGWLAAWERARDYVSLHQLCGEVGGPERVWIACVDLLKGFCTQGPLSSARVASVVEPVAHLISMAHTEGVRDLIMVMDRHSPGTAEFSAWPPHCLAGTPEAELPHGLTELAFSHEFTLVPKDSLCAFTGTMLDTLVAERGLPGAVICVGDCTDLCVYQLAMGFKLRANVANTRTRVIVPADCVATFDVPVETAERIGALPHPGDLMHSIFLYHLALNDCHVVQGVVD